MIRRLLFIGAVLAAVAVVIAIAFGLPRPAAQPSAAPVAVTAVPTIPIVTPPASTPVRTASPTATATATASPSPSQPAPPVACPAQSGGSEAAQGQIAAVRAAHQAGMDRIVFEFGPSGIGQIGVPPWNIAVASTFTGTSGRQVPVDGNAFLSVRFRNASTVDVQTGRQTFTQTDIRPGLPLVREVKLVEDFERVMIWGIGLERLACAKVTELAGPPRLVVDLPTPP